jgi:structural maintenance of chromosome 1
LRRDASPPHSKTAANALAVEERQQLEILKREERSLRDKLATATDKINKAESRREELKQELSSVEAREVAVSTLI